MASFDIPEGDERGSDQLTHVGDRLVMKLKKALYALPIGTPAGTKPVRLKGEVDLLASSALSERAVVVQGDVMYVVDPATGERQSMLPTGARLGAVHVEADGTIYGFGEGKVFAWQSGEPKPGFPKSFYGERPQKIGRHWFSHAWHGTINRMNENFEPEPGVVLGGGSGSFIGYMPQSNDLTNGRGMVRIRDGLYAVGGMGGVIQLVLWNDAENRFDVVRRIGGLTGLKGLAIDDEGRIWTSRGSWRWTDEPQSLLTLGDLEPSVCAQPVMLGGKTLCILKKHYSNVQLARGPAIDAAGLSHLETPGIKDFVLPENVTGAAVFDKRLIATTPTGEAFLLPISDQGHLSGKPTAVKLPGLKNCTSLAWFHDRLLAGDTDAIVVFDRNLQEVKRLTKHTGDVFVQSDGRRLAVSDPGRGLAAVYDSLDSEPRTFAGLDGPAQIAIAGSRRSSFTNAAGSGS
ncbi:MAG: hypothetical protein QM775_11115 [Pirellulales bacterium]